MEEENSKGVITNNFTLMELAGAFGDLGTSIPFILVYTGMMGFDPGQLFFTFGIFNIFTGALYKTPVPVQPMKAIGSFAATHPGQVTPGMISGAGLFSGLFWSLIAVTGLTERIAKLVKRPVSKGIILGLGLSFIVTGAKMMLEIPLLSLLALSLYSFLQKYKRMPVIFIIMLVGIVYSLLFKPETGQGMISLLPSFNMPEFSFGFNFAEFLKGALILAIPQIPLTLGNGVIALVEENNQIFPERMVTNRKAAMTTGLMNLISPFLGGVPMCHGAGGMAGHVKFGARTGGSTIMLGILLVTLSLFFSQSITTILGVFPKPVLGIILLAAGVELALSGYRKEMERTEFSVTLLTAGLTIWNVGAALVVGILLTKLTAKGYSS